MPIRTESGKHWWISMFLWEFFQRFGHLRLLSDGAARLSCPIYKWRIWCFKRCAHCAVKYVQRRVDMLLNDVAFVLGRGNKKVCLCSSAKPPRRLTDNAINTIWCITSFSKILSTIRIFNSTSNCRSTFSECIFVLLFVEPYWPRNVRR